MVNVEHAKLRLGVVLQVRLGDLTGKGVTLRALPARSPRIIVTDAYLKPLAGAKVYVRSHFGLKSAEKPIGVTNSAGKLTMPEAYHGACYTFRAALPGYASSEVRCPLVGSENWIDLIELAMDTVENKE